MSDLLSPGVSVRVIDESITVPASGGTVPLIVTATRRNKINQNGDLAASTVTGSGGDLTLITNRGDLLTLFGRPQFRSVGGTMLHGAETNEYGLHAAWQALGIANQAYVLNADIDLDQLEPRNDEPSEPAEGGAHWLDISGTNIGLFTWNSTTSAWEKAEVDILNEAPGTGNVQPLANGIANPRNSYGTNGDYAAITSISPMVVYEKIGGTWIMLGAQTHPNNFQMAPHTNIPMQRGDGSPLQENDVFVKTTLPNSGTFFDISVYESQTGQFISREAPMYMTNDAATAYFKGLDELGAGAVYVQIDHEGKLNPYYSSDPSRPRYSNGVAVFTPKRFNGGTITEAVSSDDVPELDLATYPISKVLINGVEITFDTSVSSNGTTLRVEDIVNHLQSSSVLKGLNIRVELDGSTRIKLIHKNGLDITVKNVGEANVDWTPNTFTDVAAVLGLGYSPSAGQQMFRKSNWESLSYESASEEPTRSPAVGTLWYTQQLRAEVLESYFDNAANAVKWRTHSWSHDNGNNSLTNKLTIRGSEPVDPTNGDIWLDSTDLDNYPAIRQYRANTWVLLDNSDQTTTDGVIFANYAYEAPFNESGTPRSDSAVFDDLAPNPQLFPEGILLFNMDYSTNNIKEYLGDGVWQCVSGNRPDGAPYMGRKSQRRMVVTKMKEAVLNSKAIRARDRFFNLITATGYPELMPELVALNMERKHTAFVIGSSPMRLPDSGNDVQNWANNANGAFEDGEDGLVTVDNMTGIWAFAGLQTDSEGNQVAVPSDTMALQVILQNDRMSYQWFAPAGDRRGLVPGTTAIGLVTEGNQFRLAEIDDGLLGVLYSNNINPIYDDEGIKIMGQKTVTDVPSSMDRINVARLVAYIRYMLPRITRSFLFQPNDAQTRQAALNIVEKFLADIAEKRGITDFVVECSTSNNTPDRIDRNELWIDIGISPMRAIEYILIPVRLQNTGDI